ncbi:hypothetical protein PENSPDRAFT_748279, partial [Peniophora sp. CONT]
MPLANLVAYNATLPISRLLIPELFSEIIHIALDDDLPEYPKSRVFETSAGDTSIHDAGPPKWRLGAAIAASHVCFAWRRLCLGTPTLWARHIGRFPQATSTHLKRSGYALLDVVYVQDPDCWRFIPSISSSRVRRIRWNVDSKDGVDHPSSALTLCMLLNGNLSNLEDLSVQIGSPSYSQSMGRLLRSESLSSTPRLTRLHFHGTFLPFIAPRLTILSLNTLTLSLSQLLDALRAAPLLETFEFLYCEVQADRSVDTTSLYPSHPNPIKLPRLEHVHVDDETEDGLIQEGVHGLLDNLQIAPHSLVVSLAFGVPFPLFAISLRTGLKCRPLSFLRLEDCWEMWAIKPHPLHLPPTYLRVSDVRIGYLDGELTAWANYGPLLRSLDFQELKCITQLELCVHIVGMWISSMHPLLYALPSVTRCWISQGIETCVDPETTCIELLSYLGSEYEDTASNPGSVGTAQTQYPFPWLRVLGINGADLDSNDILEQLLQTLMHRKEIGYPRLKMLSLLNFCRPCEGGDMWDAAASFQDLAGTVHWGREPDEGGGESSAEESSEESGGAIAEGPSDESND